MADPHTRELVRESPVAAVAALPWRREGVAVEERAGRGYLNLRGDPRDPGFLEAVADVVGPLPLTANTTAASGEVQLLWLGPDEWLLVCPTEAAADDARARLDVALAGSVHALVDVGSALTTLRLQGAHTLDLIRSGVTLDVHPRVFAPGQCAQTNFSHAMVILCAVDAVPTIDVIVRRSFADYLARWIMDWTG